MKSEREKSCRCCGTKDDLAVGAYDQIRKKHYVLNLCRSCQRVKANERHKKEQDFCSRCREPKPITRRKYCKSCQLNINNKVEFQQMPVDFNIELYQFVKQIIRREYKLYDMDIFKIVNYWCDISIFPHKYWGVETSTQLQSMFQDLILFLDNKKIKKRNVN